MNTPPTSKRKPDRKRARGSLIADIGSGDETELNMTPMIDIVFQLIIFFLITLKFKTVDERLDANLPQDRGPRMTHVIPPETPKIKLKVFRKHKADPDAAYTLVKIDNTDQVRLPGGRRAGAGVRDTGRLAREDRAFARIGAILRAKRAAHGDDAGLYCEIVAPRPDGGAVPEGDVIRLVDTLVAVGLRDIRFEGGPMPGGVVPRR